MNKNKALFLVMVIAVISIVVGIILNFTLETNPKGEKFTIFNEDYIVDFYVSDDWILGSDDRFNDPKYSYIRGFVREENQAYGDAMEKGVVNLRGIDDYYGGKQGYIDRHFSYCIETTNKLLTDGMETKKINKHEVYYYIDGDTYEIAGEPVLGIYAYVFINDDYYVHISATLKESNGYTTKDLEQFVTTVVKSLKITENDGKMVAE